MNKGKYIVIEGAEGVGKTTMVEKVAAQLRASQLPVRVMGEPDTLNDLTARSIQRLTESPEFPMSTRTEVLLYNAARSQSLETIRKLQENGVNCLVDRNYLTTLAIQYYGRGDVQDYQKINDIITFAIDGMEPDLTIVLDAPAVTLRERVERRPASKRLDTLDEAFLERVRAGYLWEAKQRGLTVVYANEDIETVFRHIWGHVAAVLSVRETEEPSQPQSVAEVLAANSPTRAAAVEPPITEAVIVKDLPKSESASRANPPKEPADTKPTADADTAGATKAVRAEQTDNSYIVIKNASGLLAEKLEWRRRGPYSEQPADTIYFDQKDAAGHYRFYIPAELRGKIRSQYIRTMNQLFDTYAKLITDVTTHVRAASLIPVRERDDAWHSATKAQAYDAVQPLLPLAATTDVRVRTSAQALEGLMVRLLSDELPEARTATQRILDEVPKALHTSLKQANSGSVAAYRASTYTNVKLLAETLLPPNHTAESDPVTLISYTPHNELDIVADVLYEHSDLPLTLLRSEIATWPYQRKVDVLAAYTGERLHRHEQPGRALEKIQYSFDLVSSYTVFRSLQHRRTIDGLERQPLSPRLGYDIPQLIEEAGSADTFEECFDLSLQLYSALQGGGFPLEAQYATLRGHKMRWKVTYNARKAFYLHEMHTGPQANPDVDKLVQQMHVKIAEVHPLLGEAMRFVGQGDDPELSKQAAERYAQYRLAKLDSGKPGE